VFSSIPFFVFPVENLLSSTPEGEWRILLGAGPFFPIPGLHMSQSPVWTEKARSMNARPHGSSTLRSPVRSEDDTIRIGGPALFAVNPSWRNKTRRIGCPAISSSLRPSILAVRLADGILPSNDPPSCLLLWNVLYPGLPSCAPLGEYRVKKRENFLCLLRAGLRFRDSLDASPPALQAFCPFGY